MLRLLQVNEQSYIPCGKKRAFIITNETPPCVHLNNNSQYDRPKIFCELQVNVLRTIGILRDDDNKAKWVKYKIKLNKDTWLRPYNSVTWGTRFFKCSSASQLFGYKTLSFAFQGEIFILTMVFGYGNHLFWSGVDLWSAMLFILLRIMIWKIF